MYVDNMGYLPSTSLKKCIGVNVTFSLTPIMHLDYLAAPYEPVTLSPNSAVPEKHGWNWPQDD